MKFLINWFEIPALDINRATEFYSKVLNIDLKILDCGKEKMAYFPEINGVSGSITVSSALKPSKDGIQITFDGGNDLNDTLAKVKNAGGMVVRPKTKIEVEGRGYFATIIKKLSLLQFKWATCFIQNILSPTNLYIVHNLPFNN